MKTITEVCQDIKRKFTEKYKVKPIVEEPDNDIAYDTAYGRVIMQIFEIGVNTGVKPTIIYVTEEDYRELLCDDRISCFTQPLFIAGVEIHELNLPNKLTSAPTTDTIR